MASFADENIWSIEIYLVGNNSRESRTPNDKIGVDRRFVKFFGYKVSLLIFMTSKQSGKLIRQPADFPQRGKSAYSSARSPDLPVKLAFVPARLRMAS